MLLMPSSRYTLKKIMGDGCILTNCETSEAVLQEYKLWISMSSLRVIS